MIWQFEIQAASSSLDAVTSVSFFDGPKGVFGDMPIFTDNSSLALVETGNQHSDIKFVQSGDDPTKPRDAFGFQLYPSMYGF